MAMIAITTRSSMSVKALSFAAWVVVIALLIYSITQANLRVYEIKIIPLTQEDEGHVFRSLFLRLWKHKPLAGKAI